MGATGGTLDKLESIPGFRTNLNEQEIRQVVDKVGCVITGATADLVPADKKLYALRDVSGTVPSIPLICASIMSKKMAEGIDALVLDVKTGSGAFMQKEEDAVRLAKAMVETGHRMGKRCVALLTDMGQPLGRMAGHSSEVAEAIDILKGKGPKDLRQLSVELSAWMFYLGERTPSVNEGRRLAEPVRAAGTDDGGHLRFVLEHPRQLVPRAQLRGHRVRPLLDARGAREGRDGGARGVALEARLLA